MNNNTILVQDICPRAKDTTKEQGYSFSDVVFLFLWVCYLQGVHRSSSLPDYIEDKKSGGQQTDCLIKNGCALIKLSSQDLQRTLKAEAKNRNERLIGTFERQS